MLVLPMKQLCCEGDDVTEGHREGGSFFLNNFFSVDSFFLISLELSTQDEAGVVGGAR